MHDNYYCIAGESGGGICHFDRYLPNTIHHYVHAQWHMAPNLNQPINKNFKICQTLFLQYYQLYNHFLICQ